MCPWMHQFAELGKMPGLRLLCAEKTCEQFAICLCKVSLVEREVNVLCFELLHVYHVTAVSYFSCDCSWSFWREKQLMRQQRTS